MLFYSPVIQTEVPQSSITNNLVSNPVFNLHRISEDFRNQPGLSEHTYQAYRQLDKEVERQVIQNWTDSKSEGQFDLITQPAVRAVIILFYILIIVIGVLSNGAVVIVAASTRKIHTVTNIFVVNLALSDLGMCMFNLPLQLHYQLTDRWIFGDLLCRVVFSAFALPMYLSTVTILLIALDRYWLIVWPLKDRLSVRQAYLLISLNVTVSITMATPVMYYTYLHVHHDEALQLKYDLCMERWPSDLERQIYTAFTFFFQFCLPLTLTSILYLLIYNRLRRRRSPTSLLARTAGAAIVPAGIPVAIRRTQQMGDSDLFSLSSVKGPMSSNERAAERLNDSNEYGVKTSSLSVTAGQDGRSSVCSTNLLCPPNRLSGQRPQQHQALSNDGQQSSAPRPRTMLSPLMSRRAREVEFSDGVTQSRNTAESRRAISRRSNKTNRILVAIVTNFIVCWLPWNLFSLVTEFSRNTVTGPHFKLVDLSLKGFAMASSCVNPLLYCWLNDSLRKDLSVIAIRLNVYRRLRPNTRGTRRQAGTQQQQGSGGQGAWGGPLNAPAADGIPCFNIQPPSEGAISVGGRGEKMSGSDGLQVPVEFECSAACSSYEENPHTASFTMDRFSSRQSSLF